MKKIFLITFACMICNSGMVLAEEPLSQVTIKQTGSHSVFKGFFLSVWSKFRAYNPQQTQSAKSKVVYSAGIRGAEATETLIQPYWKGDLTHDEMFQKELKQFTQAQQLMDKGDLQNSAEAFELFINQYSDTKLLPNAWFAKGLSHAGHGNKEQASLAMQQFITDNPKHPLLSDARQVLQQLQ